MASDEFANLPAGARERVERFVLVDFLEHAIEHTRKAARQLEA